MANLSYGINIVGRVPLRGLLIGRHLNSGLNIFPLDKSLTNVQGLRAPTILLLEIAGALLIPTVSITAICS